MTGFAISDGDSEVIDARKGGTGDDKSFFSFQNIFGIWRMNVVQLL